MGLELGLKLTRVVDEFTSANLQIVKDRAGLVFVSSETDNMFILTAHLKGYRKGSIKIEINEDGSRIAIIGEKQVQETVIAGWQVQKKGVEMKRFRKVFKIPDGVILDKITAEFNADESVLTILMPKEAKGVHGVGIEEVIEEENISGQDPGTKEQDSLVSPGERETDGGNESESYNQKENAEGKKHDQLTQNRKPIPENHQQPSKASCSKQQPDEQQDQDNQLKSDEADIKEADEGGFLKREEGDLPERKSIICAPIVAGSAILLSLVVFVFQFIRHKNQPGKRQN